MEFPQEVLDWPSVEAHKHAMKRSFRSFDALRVKIRDEGPVKNKVGYVALALNR